MLQHGTLCLSVLNQDRRSADPLRDKEALPKEDVLAAAKWDTELQLAQTSQANPEVPVLKSQRHFRPNKGFKRAQEKYLERKVVKDNKNNPSSNIKHKVCYTCQEK